MRVTQRTQITCHKSGYLYQLPTNCIYSEFLHVAEHVIHLYKLRKTKYAPQGLTDQTCKICPVEKGRHM